jgi:hypothetical protein
MDVENRGIFSGKANRYSWFGGFVLDRKQTSIAHPLNVRFTPESGHYSALHQMSANNQ